MNIQNLSIGNAFRFLGAGLINTILTAIIYIIALFVTSPAVAYALSWLAGIVFVTIFYPKKVFLKPSTSSMKRAIVAIIYLLTFFVGLTIVFIIGETMGYEILAILVSLCVTVCLNFVLMSLLLRED